MAVDENQVLGLRQFRHERVELFHRARLERRLWIRARRMVGDEDRHPAAVGARLAHHLADVRHRVLRRAVGREVVSAAHDDDGRGLVRQHLQPEPEEAAARGIASHAAVRDLDGREVLLNRPPPLGQRIADEEDRVGVLLAPLHEALADSLLPAEGADRALPGPKLLLRLRIAHVVPFVERGGLRELHRTALSVLDPERVVPVARKVREGPEPEALVVVPVAVVLELRPAPREAEAHAVS